VPLLDDLIDQTRVGVLEQYSEVQRDFLIRVNDGKGSLEIPTYTLISNLRHEFMRSCRNIKVKPVAIPEPLKVRVITKSTSEVFLLKLIQENMTLRIGKLPVFELTSGKPLRDCVSGIQQKVKSDPKIQFISGDYTAATDNLPLEIIQACVEELIEQIVCEKPEVKALVTAIALQDAQAHDVYYSNSIEIERKNYIHELSCKQMNVVRQTSGQLMGSFLSFPILCLVNYMTVQTARGNPISNGERKKLGLPSLFFEEDIRINGDDLLFADTFDVYQKWREVVKDFNLELSVGKNYFSRAFGTINSRMITQDAVLSSMRYGDLKVKNVIESWSSFVESAENSEDLYRLHKFFVYFRGRELKSSNVSLFLPMKLGGPLPDRLFQFVEKSDKNRIPPEQYLLKIFRSLPGKKQKYFVIDKALWKRTGGCSEKEDLYAEDTEGKETQMWISMPKVFSMLLDEFKNISVDTLFDSLDSSIFVRLDTIADDKSASVHYRTNSGILDRLRCISKGRKIALKSTERFTSYNVLKTVLLNCGPTKKIDRVFLQPLRFRFSRCYYDFQNEKIEKIVDTRRNAREEMVIASRDVRGNLRVKSAALRRCQNRLRTCNVR